jgi:hypothetical protein
MGDDDQKRQRSSLAVLLTVAVSLLPVVYVLAIGPIIALVDQNYISDDAYLFVYWPLIALYENCPPVQAPLDWYVDLWQ